MIETHTIAETRAALQPVRRQGRRIGLVPTMGALHEGHLSLIRAARQADDYTVVSIFVNPTQFGPLEDLAEYPRPIEQDREHCRKLGVELVFHPGVQEMYPREGVVLVHPTKISEGLCGAFRPGHFEGVATVVAKLFNIVRPDAAYFGQKDAQQAAVIRRMAEDLDFPVEIVVCPTVREPDGLAMSSRNKYLSRAQREQATCLYRALAKAEQMIHAGRIESEVIIGAMRELIVSAEPAELDRPEIDYIEIVDPDSMAQVHEVTAPVLIALAAHIGPARLIDNIVVHVPSATLYRRSP